MKNRQLFLVMLVCSLALGLAIVACDSGGDDGDGIVPNQLIGTYRMFEGPFAGDSRYDIIITSTTLTWAGELFDVTNVTSKIITIKAMNYTQDVPYELNGDILRVAGGDGVWQERKRI